MAGFISLKEPTKAMKQEAQEAGFFEYGGIQYKRIQFLTLPEIFNEQRWHCPSVVKRNKAKPILRSEVPHQPLVEKR